VAIGVGLSLFVLVVRVAAPNYAVLGNVPGTSAYHDIRVMFFFWYFFQWRDHANFCSRTGDGGSQVHFTTL